MFVQLNSLNEVKAYFNRELSGGFSESEIKQIVKALTIKRFNISSIDYMLFDGTLSESDLLFYHFALKKLKSGVPFQYILGIVEFHGVELKIDERALIPRPETEELVDWVLQESSVGQSCRILDLCSGSGCIAIALKHDRPQFEVEAVEFSEEACSLIRENIDKTGTEIQLHIFDVLSADDYVLDDKFDVWVSNPPYIPEKDKVMMGKNVLEYEPAMALFVDDLDPLIFYRKISQNALRFLKDGGWVYFEIHEELGEEVKGFLEKIGFVNIELRKDLQGRDRMVRGQLLHSRHEQGRG